MTLLEIKRTTCFDNLDKLIKKGFIEKFPDPEWHKRGRPPVYFRLDGWKDKKEISEISSEIVNEHSLLMNEEVIKNERR